MITEDDALFLGIYLGLFSTLLIGGALYLEPLRGCLAQAYAIFGILMIFFWMAYCTRSSIRQLLFGGA